MALRPARGLSSPLWSMAGLAPTMVELQRCFPILPTSSIVASSEQTSRALFEYTWRFRSTPTGRGVLHAPSVTASGHWLRVRQPRPPTPPDPRRARKPTSGAVVPLNRVRTGGGRGASVPRPPGAGVPGWFGPGRRLGPPVALRQPSVRLVCGRGGRHQPTTVRGGCASGPAGAPGGCHLGCQSNAAAPDTRGCLGGKRVMPASLATMLRKLELEIRSISACAPLSQLVRLRCPSRC